jgi:hypothetical protein
MITLFTGHRPDLKRAARPITPSQPVSLRPSLNVAASDTVHFRGNSPISDPDLLRWRDILASQVRKDLQQFKSPSNFETTQDGKSVKVPQDYIDMPRFMRGSNEGGTGQGQGEPGDEVGQVGQNGQPQPGQSSGEAQPGEGEEGEGEGEDAGVGSGTNSADDWLPKISRSEIAKAIGKDLELPNFQPRGQNNIQKIEEIWDNISRQGTPGNRHLRKSFLNAMQREMVEQGNSFDPAGIQWRRGDMRYFNTTEHPVPKENAVIIYVLDTSGSMSPKRRKMARDANFYLSTFIQDKYGEINAQLRNEAPSEKDFGNGVVEEFIIHDDDAEITTESKFYNEKKGGGTKFAPAYEKVKELIETKYPLDKWNVYVFHYTDGDTFSDQDNTDAVKVINELVKKGLNLYGYLQTTESGRTASSYEKKLQSEFGEQNRFVRRSHIDGDNPEQCRKAVYDMLGKQTVPT